MPEVVSERPTFAQAFASEAPAAESLPATPSLESQPAERANADTIVPPAAETTGDVVTPALTPGEPPKERWPDILANRRTKASDEGMAEWKQQYGWAESVDRAAVEEASRIGQLYQQDRAGYLKQLTQEALADPTLAPIIRSEAARVLAGAKQAQPESEPDIPILDQQGNVVGHLNEIVERRLAARLEKEIG